MPERFPFEPLIEALPRDDRTLRRACRALNISGATYHQFSANGLTRDQADRLALYIDKHPLEVWAEWMDED